MQSTSLANPEFILREYIQLNKPITRKGNLLVFSDSLSIKIDTPTPFLQKSAGKPYTIGSIWLYLKNKDEQLTAYMGNARREKIDSVSNRDKNCLIRYFLQGIDDVEIYDKSIIDASNLLGNKRGMETIDDTANEISTLEKNKNALSDELVLNDISIDPLLRVMDCLSKREKHSVTRNTILRIPSIRFDNVLSLCRRTFMKSSNTTEYNQTAKNSFLEELLSINDCMQLK